MNQPATPPPSKPATPETERPQIEQITVGKVIRRKKSLGKRFAENFIGENAKTAWQYVVIDVLVPAAQNTVAEAVQQGLERMIFGEVRHQPRAGRFGTFGGPAAGSTGFVNYGAASQPGARPEPRMTRRARANHDFGEIILATRVEAQQVIQRLFDLTERYGSASVSDLCDMLGQSPQFTDDKYGWTDMRGSDIIRVQQGYMLDLPPTQQIG